MSPQSGKSFNFGNFRIRIQESPLGSLETKWHLGFGPMAKHKVYYKGEGGGFPQVQAILWIRVCPWFICAPKCSNYTLTNLLFGLCKSMWVIELLVNLPSPIPKLQHTPLPLKCCEPGSTPQFLFLPLFSPLDSHLNPSKSLKVRYIFKLLKMD
jgi:hypothetical protein